MIAKFECVNISSKNPKILFEFYQNIGLPVFLNNQGYDGFRIGRQDEAYICVWDENIWGNANSSPITLVFRVDNLNKTYEEIISKGIITASPQTTAWGGQEMILKDPDGNKIVLLI